MYVFINRQRNKIKCLFWEVNGFSLYYKSLAEEKLKWPKQNEEIITLTGQHQKKNFTKKETSTIKRGRKGLSKNLPRHQIHIDLIDEEKAGAIDTFYSVVKEELDIESAKARVIE
ncbi:MAG: IS66 family insertion sequence element accessory protein TnpB [Endozoicomonadaceae bacterium]|nr:IS66 family insertion sequence element accessory protein TnpB [Endozoicomonadaceae bacterium]